MATRFSKKKLKWFLRNYGRLTRKELSQIMGLHIKSLSRAYKKVITKGVNNYYSPDGPKRKERPLEWTELILKEYAVQHCGAKNMELILRKRYNLRIPHNYIHKVLMSNEMAREDKKKQKQRKTKPYVRGHSNSAWHTDYKWIENTQSWLIAYIDDHSRFITAYGMFSEATTENALRILKIGIQLYEKPREIITDKGAQFYANKKTLEGNKGVSTFERELEKLGIRLITARRNHPQTNGKIERWFKTWIEHHWRYKDIHEFVHWYNCIRYHSAIDFDTPLEHYRKGMRKLLTHR